ncbi:hypothetical protein JR316_0011951 [Psilocybe cubensis]|uniref:Heterokaryon incompatibility domain-containing protein n=2 Tax=Psilocybe cubensis TaxID=181762 RepID=A0A8H8CFE0_PSICU|nr:hypothetical protein JR316_0011951 [Psilocybe cubensis]KAH9476376.1 hypothetical protein JR316_0011951 [Psilocybe cubensis]
MDTKVLPLCDVCQTLDLQKTNTNREPTKYHLGNLGDIHRKGSGPQACPCCSLLIPFLTHYGSYDDDYEVSIEWKKKGGFFFSTEGDNLAFLNEDIATSPYGSARAVHNVIDPNLIKKWLAICERDHGDPCNPQGRVIKSSSDDDGVAVLRLVDVIDLCIVEASPGDCYVALSYIWGPSLPDIRLTKGTLSDLTTKGSLSSFFPIMPKTIVDAIDLVRRIGERYLWVDMLCLLQDDDEDMLDGIAHMDLVYQCAACTIIAAYGEDFNAGLPGLNAESRVVDQQITEVLPGIRMTSTTGVYNDMQSIYTTRGWTLQELVLSHRTLVFTKNRIYFRCRSNCMSEDTIYDNFPSAVNTVLHSGSGISFLADSEPSPLHAYTSQLFRYADRELSKLSDTIHAFTGILRFLSVQAKSGILEGLFTSSFDASVLFWDNFPLANHAPGRRDGFPSWSWAGWTRMRDGYSRFCTSPATANAWLRSDTYIVWYKRRYPNAELELIWDLDSQLKHGKPEDGDVGYRPTSEDPYGRDPGNWNVEGRQTKPDTSNGHCEGLIREEMKKREYSFLHFFAYTVLVCGFGTPPESSNWAKTHPILGKDGAECGGLTFDDLNARESADGPSELVILSKVDKYDDFFNDSVTHERPCYWVMLIERMLDGREDSVLAERRGIGFLFEDCMEHVLEPGKVWKEIVLT